MGLTFAQPWALLLLALLPLVVWMALRGTRGGVQRRRLAATLRALLTLLVVGALAGAQVVRPADDLSVVFLVDASDSVGPTALGEAENWLRQSLAAMAPDDRAGIIVFGGNALVERVPSSGRQLDDLQSRPATGRTDLGAAIRLGLALLPADSRRRLVVFSDGRDTEGGLEAALRMAAASGVAVGFVEQRGATGDDAAVARLVAPSHARQGDRFEVVVHITSTVAGRATLRLFAATSLIAEQAVDLQRGETVIRTPVTASTPGFQSFRAEIEPAADAVSENNSLTAFTTVRGPARVLIVEGAPGDGEALAAALAAAGLTVERVAPGAAPLTLPGLVTFDAVALVDVPAEALGPRMELLQQYVRDLGHGLVVVGGEDSYGLGGYANTPLEAALPVSMQMRSEQQLPQVALGLTLDKSGSMGRCHAAPGETAPGRMIQSGVAKIDIAKEAAVQSLRLLSPTDEVGIVAFDSQARWVAQRRPLAQQPAIADQLGSLHAEGGTNIYAGLHEAVQSMLASQARVRHIILVTDGWSRTGDFDALLDQLNGAGITLSVIGAGGGAADFLRGLAERGGGRYYDAASLDDTPRIFLRETKLALRSYIQAGQFTPRRGLPSPIVDGFDSLPALTGYVATTAKPTAQPLLLSEQRDPILAAWQYGLGRAVAWTSDATGRWAAAWLAWPGFSRFWAQAVKWTLPATDPGLTIHAAVSGDRATLTVGSTGAGGERRDDLTTTVAIVDPDGRRREQPLRQTAPGRFEAELTGLAEGAHLVTAIQRQSDGAATTVTGGFVVGYSPEYALPAATTGRAAATSAMARLVGPGAIASLTRPDEAFARGGLAPVTAATDVWPLLALLAALLLPIDIAARRLSLDRADLARLTAARPGTARGSAPPRWPTSPLLARVLARRERAGQRSPGAPPSAPLLPPAPTPAAPSPTAAPGGQSDTLARLREARRRARRGQDRRQP